MEPVNVALVLAQYRLVSAQAPSQAGWHSRAGVPRWVGTWLPGPSRYLQDLIHDFLHDLTLGFRVAGAQQQEEIQVMQGDTEHGDNSTLC